MRGTTEFIKVKRLIHNDEMTIPKWVAEKYPDRFEIIVEKKKRVRKKKEVVNELPSNSTEG